jgi:hypothetical protein
MTREKGESVSRPESKEVGSWGGGARAAAEGLWKVCVFQWITYAERSSERSRAEAESDAL